MSSNRSSEIAVVAVGILEKMFQPVQVHAFKPREGTIIRQLWDSRKLDRRQQEAWDYLVADVAEAIGKSSGVTSSYQERVQTSTNLEPARNWTSPGFKRLEALRETLEYHESILLRDLVYNHITGAGLTKIELIGFARTRYKNDSQARAAGVATILALLNRVAKFYQIGGY